jgi:methyl-accepting chemotaxis protein
MQDALLESLTLLNVSGYLIIATILGLLAAGVVATFAIRARYAAIAKDLRERGASGSTVAFESAVLSHVVRDAREALRVRPSDINTQAIIEHNFQLDLKGLLTGERFVKATTSLVIILGLVGTFYGLTLSIGRLAALVSSDATDASLITESLTAGLTQALTGMSVAFSTSLFGIVAAIVMTLLGVFCNVSDRRTALMAQIEAYLDNVLLSGIARGDSSDRLDRSMQAFGQTVERLEGAVGHFESALQTFATSTRDFQEFNLHLKDNVQRMSLGFADLSETLKAHARSTQSRG